MKWVAHVAADGTPWLGHFTVDEWRAIAAMREHCALVLTEYAALCDSVDAAVYLAARPDVKARLDLSNAAAKRLIDAIDDLPLPSKEVLDTLERQGPRFVLQ